MPSLSLSLLGSWSNGYHSFHEWKGFLRYISWLLLFTWSQMCWQPSCSFFQCFDAGLRIQTGIYLGCFCGGHRYDGLVFLLEMVWIPIYWCVRCFSFSAKNLCWKGDAWKSNCTDKVSLKIQTSSNIELIAHSEIYINSWQTLFCANNMFLGISGIRFSGCCFSVANLHLATFYRFDSA